MIYAEPKIEIPAFDDGKKSESNQKDRKSDLNSSAVSISSITFQKGVSESDFDFDLISASKLRLLHNKYHYLFKTCSLKTVNQFCLMQPLSSFSLI